MSDSVVGGASRLSSPCREEDFQNCELNVYFALLVSATCMDCGRTRRRRSMSSKSINGVRRPARAVAYEFSQRKFPGFCVTCVDAFLE